MWESFSFFGMRALLVLYLVTGAGYNAKDAVILYTLYIASVKIFAGAGGYIVDRFLGYKQAVIIGGTLIVTGHLFLTFSSFFFVSLGCIVAGSAIFRVSLQTLLGLIGDSKGFTIFYVGMNFGGLLAAVLCGFVAQIYGWHAGFGLAALGMIIGMGFFLSKLKLFDDLEKSKTTSPFITLPMGYVAALGIALLLTYFNVVHAWALPLGLIAFVAILSKVGRKFSIVMPLLLLIAFSTAEELWGSLLMLFSETHIDRLFFGFEIPSAAIAATNPLTIIFLGPLLAKREMRYELKLAIAFLALAFAFFILYVASIMPNPSVIYFIVGLAAIAIGELFLVPTILEAMSKMAPGSGLMMGATIIALSMGTLLSGEVARIPYGSGVTFLLIGSAASIIFVGLLTKLRFRGRTV